MFLRYLDVMSRILIQKIAGFFLMSMLALQTDAQSAIDTSVLLVQHRVYFETNSAEITERDQEKIDSIISLQSDQTKAFFYLTGHTDDVGDEASNKLLSEQRVNALEAVLLRKKVSTSFIRKNAFGESDPLADNESAKGRSLNRRATIALYLSKKLLPVTGVIQDDITKEGLSGWVEVKAKNYNQKVETDDEGNFDVLIPTNEAVTIDLNADNYFFKTIRLFKDSNAIVKPIKVPLGQLEVGKVFELESMLFKGGLAVLLPKSEPILPRLEKMMRMNPEVCIEIAGHVNLPFSPDTDVESSTHGLSIARSLIVHDYLLEHGINHKRLMARGYGNWEMKFPRAYNEEEQQKNRRVEVKVRPCDTTAIAKNDTIYIWQQYRLPGDKLLKQLEDISVKDQKYRKLIKTTRTEFGNESPEMEALWAKIKQADQENLEAIENIIAEHGWVGGQRFRKGGRAIFMVLQHSPLEIQEKYFPMLEMAVKRGTATNNELALMTDRIRVGNDLPQIYGSQLIKNASGKYEVAPIENLKNVNFRRSEMGLEPMKSYLKKFGLNWESEKAKLESNGKLPTN